MPETRKKGIVILAGAGPGDPELITIKLQKFLRSADVIISDRLVNPEIISVYAHKDVHVIVAGKQGYSNKSYSQQDVTALIIEHALRGKRVVRLKGGDVAIFSNVLDEIEALIQNGIAFEIIPGISAASGASAYTGIPLTARGYSQGVQLLTFNPNSNYTAERWQSLAVSGDTLIFYMAAKNLDQLVSQLAKYGCPADTPLAVIEQATTQYQQVHITTIEKYSIDFAGKNFSSPSLVIVGKVVSLHRFFRWFHSNNKAGSIFKEIEKK